MQTGIKVMDAKGKAFDADLHEAITQVPAPEEKLKGKVIEIVEQGYLLNEKVIRFAKMLLSATNN
jgi:molecular chaperone GrpE